MCWLSEGGPRRWGKVSGRGAVCESPPGGGSGGDPELRLKQEGGDISPMVTSMKSISLRTWG